MLAVCNKSASIVNASKRKLFFPSEKHRLGWPVMVQRHLWSNLIEWFKPLNNSLAMVCVHAWGGLKMASQPNAQMPLGSTCLDLSHKFKSQTHILFKITCNARDEKTALKIHVRMTNIMAMTRNGLCCCFLFIERKSVERLISAITWTHTHTRFNSSKSQQTEWINNLLSNNVFSRIRSAVLLNERRGRRTERRRLSL